MKVGLVLALAVLAMLAAPAAMATSVVSDVLSNSTTTQYIYTFTSTETNDRLSAFHVFAPIGPDYIVDWTADRGWLFGYDDSYGGSLVDYFWFTIDPDIEGLPNTQTMSVSFSVPSTLYTNDKLVVPGYPSNWGFETVNYADYGVTYGMNSISVPTTLATNETPEPMSMCALGMGLVGLILKRRAK